MEELELMRAYSVHNHAKFLAGVQMAINAHKTYTDEELKTADVENRIVEDISELCLKYLECTEPEDTVKTVRKVYAEHRVGSLNAANSILFLRFSNGVSLAFRLIDELSPATEDGGDAEDASGSGADSDTSPKSNGKLLGGGKNRRGK